MVGERSLSKATGAGTVPVPGQQSSVAGCSHLLLPPGEVWFWGVFDHFVYLFSVTLGPCCCARAFPRCSRQELVFLAVRRFLSAVASLVREHGSNCEAHGLRSCTTPAQELSRTGSVAPCVRNPPGPGIEPVSPASAAGFLTTAPPGKSPSVFN